MKRAAMIILAGCLALNLVSCKTEAPGQHEHEGAGMKAEQPRIDYYTCSMHPFIRQPGPGRCPVCGMPLVPKYATLPTSGSPVPPSAEGRSEVNMSEEKLQLIGVKTEAAAPHALAREIEAFGRVAYDPDLFVAQNDYLIARRTGGSGLGGLQGSLVKAARARLELMGMSAAEIDALGKSGRAQGDLVLPEKDGSVWLYGSVFESDLPWVKPGTAVEIAIPGNPKTLTGAVASLDPTIDAGTRTAQFRLRVSNSEGQFKPNMFVRMRIRGGGENALAVPENALIDTGKRKLVYVETAPGRFLPREVTTGAYGTGYVEIRSGLTAGDKVVTQGGFFLDSESSMKAAAGAGGGHQH